jgi:hypothetical protein
MPKQNKRNNHLQKARETKKLKKTIGPITDKEVFENESQIDANVLNELDVNESGLEIEELIYENIESDDDWKDMSLTTELESAFSKLIRISNKNDTLESKGRPLIYTGAATETIRQKQRILKNAAKGTSKITTFFQVKTK